jgi:hypothetical protein
MEQLASASGAVSPGTIRAACTGALNGIIHYLPLLGFLLRSTNVRNGFEIYAPLLSLARQLLGKEIKLVISSEWDYSPFTYTSIPYLPGFVLIGLPAPESANPLLVPLAGHELGHSIWSVRKLRAKYLRIAEKYVLAEIDRNWGAYSNIFSNVEKAKLETDMFARQTWSLAHEWALRQAEETFCDYCGIAIFRESFLHSFAYLIAPSFGGSRSCVYPDLRRRIENILSAAKAFGIPEVTGYADLFDNDTQSDLGMQDRFLLSLADAASQSLCPNLTLQRYLGSS